MYYWAEQGRFIVGRETTTCHKNFANLASWAGCQTLRVQVPKNHTLTQNLYYNYYDQSPQYPIVGSLDPLGDWMSKPECSGEGHDLPSSQSRIPSGYLLELGSFGPGNLHVTMKCNMWELSMVSLKITWRFSASC